MKILLVAVDFIRKVGDKQSFFIEPSAPTLSINYLASILRNQGNEVIVLDSLFEYLRTEFSNTIDIVKGVKNILKEEKNIDCVGISFTSPTRNYALNIARIVKAFNPQIKIIAGGPHITILREMFFKKYYHIFDILVIGEGDKTFPELINAFDRKIPLENVNGILYIDNKGKIKKTNPRVILSEKELNNINIVPFTDYLQYQELLPNGIIPAITLVTTRGCPYYCTFCYSPRFWRKYRAQSAKRVLAEIEYIVKKYKVKNIRFQDDVFTFNKNRSLRIFEGIKNKGWKIDLYMHTRFDCIDEDIIKAYAMAGGKDIYFGLESGSEKIRRAMKKNSGITNEKILEICKTVKKYNINLGLWVIWGYPEETDEDIQTTYDLFNKIKPDEVNCNPIHVHPYTPLFFQAKKEGIYKLEDWLDEKKDFFPYHKGLAGQYIFSLGKIITKQFSAKQIKLRTSLERDIETNFGGKHD